MNPAHNTQFFDRSDATMDIDQDEVCLYFNIVLPC